MKRKNLIVIGIVILVGIGGFIRFRPVAGNHKNMNENEQITIAVQEDVHGLEKGKGTGTSLELTDTTSNTEANIDESRFNVADDVEALPETQEEIEYLNYLDEQEATNEKDSADVEESDIETLDKVMYAQGNVNTRSGPSTDYEKSGSLGANQEVKVTGQSKSTGWYEIEVNGNKQYVSNKYLSDNKIEIVEEPEETLITTVQDPKPADTTNTTNNNSNSNSNILPGGNAVLPESLQGLSMGDASSLAAQQNQGTAGELQHYESGEGIHAQ